MEEAKPWSGVAQIELLSSLSQDIVNYDDARLALENGADASSWHGIIEEAFDSPLLFLLRRIASPENWGRQQNPLKLIELLIEYGADVNQAGFAQGRSELPLLIALDNNNKQLAEWLLKHGANIWHHAFVERATNSRDILLLLQRYGLDVNTWIGTMLHSATNAYLQAIRLGNMSEQLQMKKVLDYLIFLGVNPEKYQAQRPLEGYLNTLLPILRNIALDQTEAALEGLKKIEGSLRPWMYAYLPIKDDSRIDLVNIAFRLAAAHENIAIVTYLFRQFMPILRPSTLRTSFLTAALTGHISILEMLYNAQLVEGTEWTQNLNGALRAAAQQRHRDVVAFILKIAKELAAVGKVEPLKLLDVIEHLNVLLGNQKLPQNIRRQFEQIRQMLWDQIILRTQESMAAASSSQLRPGAQPPGYFGGE